jgi:FixJ family two-component response regulator
MFDGQQPRMITGTLIYNSEQNCLELDGYELQCGEQIEIRVFGSWIPGLIAVDAGGWYLFTVDNVGIRLNTGLPARFNETPPSTHSILQPSLTPPPRVLIVDDDTALLTALPRMLVLRIPQVQIDTCDSSLDALRCIQEKKYEAIVSDIKMPGMDGLTLLTKTRELQPDTPTLLITGHGEHDLAIQALRGGAYDYIQKPIDRDSFVTALLRAIQMCQLRRRVEEQQIALATHARSLERLVQQRTSELVEANDTKDKVITLVTQEMKAPLKHLKDIMQVLRLKLAESEMAELVSQGFTEIERSISRAEDLVHELLKTSRIEAGLFIPHRQHCDLVAFCNRFLEDFCEREQLPLTCEYRSARVEIEADQEQLTQIFMMLLSGIENETQEAPPITIALQQSRREALVSMRNLGPHTGSGLYIARKIMERHDGHLEVQRFPEERHTFFLMFPLLKKEETDFQAQTPSTHALWTIARPT